MPPFFWPGSLPRLALDQVEHHVDKFWARGYFVSTIGRGEEMIRAYIRNQEMADKQLDQLQLKLASS